MKHIAIVKKNGHFPLEIREFATKAAAVKAHPDCEIMSEEFYHGYKLAHDRLYGSLITEFRRGFSAAAEAAKAVTVPARRWNWRRLFFWRRK
jgi:hypothetical protein